MSADQIISLAGSLGFPAVAAIGLWMWVKDKLASENKQSYEREKRLHEDVRALRRDFDDLQAEVRNRLVGLIEKNEATMRRSNHVLETIGNQKER